MGAGQETQLMKTFTRILHLVLPWMVAAAHAGELQVYFTDNDGNPVKDAVIEIISSQFAVPADWDYTGVMDQVDEEFVNNVITVVAGSRVSFPNSDDIQHHVYSFSENNTFELPLYAGNTAEPVLFPEPGVTVVGCNIHDWMIGYIYVGRTHMMARSDDYGVATIRNLEPGDYTFTLWHERARRGDLNSEHMVTVQASGATQLPVQLNLGRDRRIRRSPTGSGSAY
jgi:plastocyanin